MPSDSKQHHVNKGLKVDLNSTSTMSSRLFRSCRSVKLRHNGSLTCQQYCPFSTVPKSSIVDTINLRQFVPNHDPVTQDDVNQLQQFINSNRSKLIVLTGAGISTESGLPDYRSAGVGLYEKSNHKPVQHLEFITSENRRKSYWCRNYFAFDRFNLIQPNVNHRILANWQQNRIINQIITQNVDKLHQKAGADEVIELHGSGFIIKCMSCSNLIQRDAFQAILDDHNPAMRDIMINSPTEVMRPDGDVLISDQLVAKFNVPKCSSCNGILKPNITFFGDNVSKDLVDRIYSLVESNDGLLVIGSSLHVYSGYRFVLHAIEKKKNVAIVSIGKSRADHLQDEILFIRKRAGELLPLIDV